MTILKLIWLTVLYERPPCVSGTCSIIMIMMIGYGYGNLISPGEAFSHEATLQGTQNSTDTSNSGTSKGRGRGGKTYIQ